MHVVKRELPADLSELYITVFADEHIGDPLSNHAALKARIEKVRTTPNLYAILNGDLMNNATKTSVSDTYAEAMPPQRQLDMLVELFTPIKDKILCITPGNHEQRTYIKEGIDLTAVLASRLGLLDYYAPTAAYMFLRFGQDVKNHRSEKITYTFYITHGRRGGRTVGSKMNALADLRNIIEADVYIHSHTHLPAVLKQPQLKVNVRTRKIVPYDALFINTAANLEFGGYGETFEYQPASTATPLIYLSGRHKEANGRL